MRIRLLGSLKTYVGKEEVELRVREKLRLREILEEILKIEPALSRAIEPGGRPRPGYLVFINGADYMVYEGEETPVGDEDVVTIVPVSHGGV